MARVKLTDEERKQRDHERVKKWRLENADKVKEYNKKYAEENPDKVKKANRKSTQKYHKQRKQNDSLFKLRCNIAACIRNSINHQGFIKQSKTDEILGCTFKEFKQHIESQFEPWMTWNNYGCKTPLGPDITWDLDHIIPVSSAATEEELIILNHYTNFQPLCSYINRFVKRDKLP